MKRTLTLELTQDEMTTVRFLLLQELTACEKAAPTHAAEKWQDKIINLRNRVEATAELETHTHRLNCAIWDDESDKRISQLARRVVESTHTAEIG